MRRGSQVPPTVRADVLRRDRGCLGARLPGTCSGGLELHHLTNRSQGRDDTPDNLLTLCSAHHRWVTENPAEATERGFSVPGWVHDDPDLWLVAIDWAFTRRCNATYTQPPWNI